MFIRRTKTRKDHDFFTFRLVRSERIGKKVKQRTLLNLGSNFNVAPKHWSLLCYRIKQILSGQSSLLDYEIPSELESHAQQITAQLLAKRRVGFTTELGSSKNSKPDYQCVDVNSTKTIRPRSVGVENVALWAMDQLGLRQLLNELELTPSLRDAAIGSIVARMAEPGSEQATRRWLAKSSALGELIGVEFEKMGAMQLYRASDALMAHRETLERHLFERAMELFDLSPTITLYDLTNTYFEGGVDGIAEAKRGHSKEKRSDCPLLTLGMVVDASGFTRRFKVFAGNVREHQTLSEMLEQLDAPANALVVMDRGIATEDGVQWLQEQGYKYVVVSRERNRQFDPEGAIRLETASNHGVILKKVLSKDGKEVRLYCFSESRAAKEESISKRFTEKFEEGLTALSEKLTRPRTVKRIDKIWQSIGRLQGESQGISQHYKVEVDTDDSGKYATAVRFTRKPVSGTMLTDPGVYCLRSNETDWDEAKLWRTYFTLTDIEAVFRSLKSELGLRPIFHWKSVRAEGHLFITVIAYQLVQVIRTKLRLAGKQASWNTLRNILEDQRRTTSTLRRRDGKTLHVRTTSQPESEQQEILGALGADFTAGGMQKTVV